MDDKPSRHEFVMAALERIEDAAKQSGDTLGGFTKTAIMVELQTMIEVGLRNPGIESWEERNKAKEI